MKFRCFALALAFALFAPTFARPADAPERWRLADLYASTDAWHADAARLQAQLAELKRCRGRLGVSARRLAACLDLRADIVLRHDRLATYASLLHHEDTGEAAAKELEQRAEHLGSQVGEADAFVRPELLSLGRARLERLVAAEPALRKHRYPLQRVLRMQPHTLDADGEALLATLALATNGGAEAYSMLVDADLQWPTVTLADGRDVKVDQPGYERLRQLPSREDRKRAMLAFFGRWKDYERSFGVTFYEMLKRDAAYAKVRRYADSLSAALAADALPGAVLDTLIRETQAHLPTFHRYLRLRAKLLNLPDLGYHDVYVPLVESSARFTLERAKPLLRDAFAPLGPDYGTLFAAALDERWTDVYPRPRKRAGAYVNAVWGVHPYVLLNHNDDYESLTTLAHEWGHAMHSVLANRAQPFVTAGYATFIAEIASTLNEALLLDHLLKVARDDDERLFYLGSALETLRGTFFRQAMFAEFERDVHARADRGEALSGQALSRIYGELLRRHHGEALGVMTIDPAYDVEWAYIPHFYNGFYVFQYATSIAASALFADDIVARKPGARERYLALLAAGGSDDPYRLVKAAGVDLATPAPYRALVARMNRLMDDVEAIVARRTTRR